MCPVKQAQIIIGRRLFKKKQVVYFYFNREITKNILFEVLMQLQNIEYFPIRLTCDLGGGNRGLFNELEVDCKKPYITKPFNNQKFYLIPDFLIL